ncbi:hypothetical protein JQ557_23090 [Bradyrhizobium sp. U87765 SZCCT0131]|uniref:hypothetical protein n=1 Tax=unclassified Bradyrhizobium TaxID=2631580 RepID=UPI001BA5655A|nr:MULTISPECIES: hypothetical protein [unclassified Bradyrhizobium]MBR1220906.1 hypothetical protein [Bradyrhizobium sp. U87765 SZCCT0131]MBR1260274.1 hypothetical protein [Bradyrhizobium sp. U87765 SZCCT0134]MBR1307477.1 hypothetical protein [Bradyrhizobium sp. U87765 SZCCT0110]MBR1321431.1 hypothetical protein [Bradyrhizobium sp. U87765 SZCCT0109]MBR1349744.1 hypothetical protein [Bradyrhizobium sp. U87765 SZCCT0048]
MIEGHGATSSGDGVPDYASEGYEICSVSAFRAAKLIECFSPASKRWRWLKELLSPSTVAAAQAAVTPRDDRSSRSSLLFSDAEFRLNDRFDTAPNDIRGMARAHFDDQALSALVLWIATTNMFNRINVATRQIPGETSGF